MSSSRSALASAADEDAALVELTSILPAVDRLRFAALGRITLLSAAKQKSLLRQEKALLTRTDANAAAAQATRQRIEHEKQFSVAVTVEVQRTQATTVVRDPDALTLHGRVVDLQGLGVAGMTVSATEGTGKSAAFVATDANGYYSLLVPVGTKTIGAAVTLLVSDRKRAVVYRGTEQFSLEPDQIHYRELITGVADPTQPPVPPPEIDPESVLIPDVFGLRKEVALAQLRSCGLAAELSTKPSTAENTGHVIAQTPKAGTNVAPRSIVAIIIGAPPTAVDVPKVVGLTVADAKAVLKKSKLILGTVSPADASAQAEVVQQAPAAGTAATPESPVDVVAREPVETITVPGVVEMKLPAAHKAISAAGLVIGRIDPPDASKEATVVTQAPAAGGEVKAGSAVHLVLREPGAKSTVPALSRFELAAARLALEKAGLRVGKIVPAGATNTSMVVGQAPVAGTEVKPDSAVDLEVRLSAEDAHEPPTRNALTKVPKSTLKPATSTKKAKSPKPPKGGKKR